MELNLLLHLFHVKFYLGQAHLNSSKNTITVSSTYIVVLLPNNERTVFD